MYLYCICLHSACICVIFACMYLYCICLHVFGGRPVIGGKEAFSCSTKCATPATCVALHACTYTVQSFCQRVCHIVLLHSACTSKTHHAQSCTVCVLLRSVCKAFAFACCPAYYLSFMSAVCTQCCQPSAFWLIKLGAGGVPWGSSLCPLGLQVPTCHPGIPSNDARVSSRIQLIHVEQHDPTPPGATKEARSSHRCRV